MHDVAEGKPSETGAFKRRMENGSMEDISLHILDIVENSTQAGASLVEISLIEKSEEDLLTLVIKDNGKGMAKDLLENVRDPFTTTRTTRRVGLGISLLEDSAREAGGGLTIQSGPDTGTIITATFKASHIDRKPIGDIGSTIVALILGNPHVEFFVETNIQGKTVVLDTGELKGALEEGEIANPQVLESIREMFDTK